LLNDSNEVVYQGIAQRAFKQQFTLAENVEVHGADLVNGMLTIALEKIIPDAQKPRSIDIKTKVSKLLHLNSMIRYMR
jgi:molecular chaperone IbpA